MRVFAVTMMALAGLSAAKADPVACYSRATNLIRFQAYEYNVKYATELCRYTQSDAQTDQILACFQGSQNLMRFQAYEYNIAYGVSLCSSSHDAAATLECFRKSQESIHFS